MSDTQPIMRDHSDTSEEEQNELRKIAQDNDADDTLIGAVDDATSQITSTLDPERRDEDDLARDAVLNDREQRQGA